MNKYITSTFEMIKSIINLFAQNLILIETEPLVKEISDELIPIEESYMLNLQIANKTSSGATQKKIKLKRILSKSLFQLMALISNQAYKTNDDLLVSSMDTTESKLNNLSTPALLSKSAEVIAYCEANTESLESWGIKTALVDKTKADEIAFADIVDEPLQIRTARKVATQMIEQLETKGNQLINKRLTPMVKGAFEDNNPEFLSKYQEIVHHDKVPTSRIAVKGSIYDMENKEAILNCWIEIPEANISYRPNSKYGKFLLKNLEPGTYTLTIKQENYIAKTIQFSHAWGFTTKLVIELEMTEVAKQQREVEVEVEMA